MFLLYFTTKHHFFFDIFLVNLDDCWQVSRDAQGTIQADPALFPNGIPPLVDYIHSRKLKFGLYSDRGNMTCQRRPGSLGYEKKDANTYAAWGVDYLKLDSCYTDATPTEVEYSLMRDALNASGRPIFYSLCGTNIDQTCLSSIFFLYDRRCWCQ